jgi:hypothetical protein
MAGLTANATKKIAAGRPVDRENRFMLPQHFLYFSGHITYFDGIVMFCLLEAQSIRR